MNFFSSSTFGKNAISHLKIYLKTIKNHRKKKKIGAKFLMKNKCNFNNFSEAHKLGNTIQHHVISLDHSCQEGLKTS